MLIGWGLKFLYSTKKPQITKKLDSIVFFNVWLGDKCRKTSTYLILLSSATGLTRQKEKAADTKSESLGRVVPSTDLSLPVTSVLISAPLSCSLAALLIYQLTFHSTPLLSIQSTEFVSRPLIELPSDYRVCFLFQLYLISFLH